MKPAVWPTEKMVLSAVLLPLSGSREDQTQGRPNPASFAKIVVWVLRWFSAKAGENIQAPGQSPRMIRPVTTPAQSKPAARRRMADAEIHANIPQCKFCWGWEFSIYKTDWKFIRNREGEKELVRVQYVVCHACQKKQKLIAHCSSRWKMSDGTPGKIGRRSEGT